MKARRVRRWTAQTWRLPDPPLRLPSMKRLLAFGAALAAATVLVRPAGGIQAQSAGLAALAHIAAQTVWDSVYSGDQAARGESTYKSTCMKCHGATLAGTDSAVS